MTSFSVLMNSYVTAYSDSCDKHLPADKIELTYERCDQWIETRNGFGITSRDNDDLPAEIQATYQYQGWSGRSTGSVRITFTDGLPECLYFFDRPTTCRTADRRIVAKYAEGDYQIQ